MAGHCVSRAELHGPVAVLLHSCEHCLLLLHLQLVWHTLANQQYCYPVCPLDVADWKPSKVAPMKFLAAPCVPPQAHSCFTKAGMVAGVQHLRLLPAGSDTQFAVQPQQLKQAVAEDLEAGLIPFYFMATIGESVSSRGWQHRHNGLPCSVFVGSSAVWRMLAMVVSRC